MVYWALNLRYLLCIFYENLNFIVKHLNVSFCFKIWHIEYILIFRDVNIVTNCFHAFKICIHGIGLHNIDIFCNIEVDIISLLILH